MTQPAATSCAHGVVVVGSADAATDLLAAGIHDFVLFDREVVSAVFDDGADTWTLTARDGEVCCARTVVACTSPLVPVIPDVPGRRQFRGTVIHAATPVVPDVGPDTRVAALGGDSGTGVLIDRLSGSGAGVKVFPLAPRRAVSRPKRTLRRRRAAVISSPIQEVTAVGVRTVDGVHHEADVIVYGAGRAVRAGLLKDTLVGSRGTSLLQVWVDGAEPYLGVAVHGFPNYFIADGPDRASTFRHIAACLQLMGRHTRIEVRRSAQGLFSERIHLHQPSPVLDASAFELSSATEVQDDAYDGPAVLTTGESSHRARVILAGRIEPIDGQYHWQGTVYDPIPDELVRARSLTVTVGDRTAGARITERTPQGTHSIAGVGAPPFRPAPLELS